MKFKKKKKKNFIMKLYMFIEIILPLALFFLTCVNIILLFSLLFQFIKPLKNSLHFQNDKNKKLNYIDRLYFSAITFTTTGYGDITPKNKTGKVVTIIYSFVSLITLFGGLLSVIPYFIENFILTIFI